MTSGARCIFLLPKIQDTPSYKKLYKARNIKQPLPRNLLEHGTMLAQIAKHKDFPKEWVTELLFFPNNWLEMHTSEAWLKLQLFLYKLGWESTDYWRNKMVYDLVWDIFVKELTRHNIRIMPHIVNIVHHLIMIGLGVLPGFGPTIDDEIAPVEAFQIDFIDIYGLKQFAPTIMIPKYITQPGVKYIYWSLQLPTYFELTPKPRKESSIINDLREIKKLIQLFIDAVVDKKIEAVMDTPFYDFIKKVKFEFFHSDVDSSEEGIRLSSEMLRDDGDLIKCPTKFGRRGFSDISPFARGCIRISLLNSENFAE